MLFKHFLKDFPLGFEHFKNIWISSDQHFGHKNILEFEPVRIKHMEADGFVGHHDDWLVQKWNEQVGKDDLVIHLGDMMFKGLQTYPQRLNGTVLLILGNHCRKPTAYANIENLYVVDGIFKAPYKNEVGCEYLTGADDPLLSGLIMGSTLFCHYPIFSNDPHDLRNPKIIERISRLYKIFSDEKLGFNVHGHVHSREGQIKRSFNVCIDNNSKFELYKFSEVY